jgi:hypothetical protein
MADAGKRKRTDDQRDRLNYDDFSVSTDAEETILPCERATIPILPVRFSLLLYDLDNVVKLTSIAGTEHLEFARLLCRCRLSPLRFAKRVFVLCRGGRITSPDNLTGWSL